MPHPHPFRAAGNPPGPAPRRAAVRRAVAPRAALVRILLALAVLAALAVAPAAAQAPRTLPEAAARADLSFRGLAGDRIAPQDWEGRAVLLTNTASMCGFTRQYEDLQAVADRFADRGLIVLAVPSDDFNQEFATDAEVAEFCEIAFGLTIPMTTITPVRGPGAHPFYRWLAEAHGIEPAWNFHKVLIGPDGRILGHWGSATRPNARPILRAIEAALE